MRTREDIVFSLTGDEGIIDYKIKHTTYLVLTCDNNDWTREELLNPYNIILANAILNGWNTKEFDGKTFESVYHVDEYILQHQDSIPLMIKLIKQIYHY